VAARYDLSGGRDPQLARLPWAQGVVSSNLTAPTNGIKGMRAFFQIGDNPV